MTQNSLPVADHLVQAGRPPKTDGRHVNLPIASGSTIVFHSLAACEAARDAQHYNGTLHFGRYGNAASFQLEEMLPRMEGATGVTLTSSGVAAITLTVISNRKCGR